MALSKVGRKLPSPKIWAGQPLAPCFVPRGRTENVIYLVVVKDHPRTVKIGRTKKWKSRRREYATWNLAPGDGIVAERIFRLTEEYVDLDALEADLIKAMPFPVVHGREWFRADIDEMGRCIDRFLCASELSYV
jgi:hypothetical protein